MNTEKINKSEIFFDALIRLFLSWIFSKILAYFGIFTILGVKSFYFIFLFLSFVLPVLVVVIGLIFVYVIFPVIMFFVPRSILDEKMSKLDKTLKKTDE